MKAALRALLTATPRSTSVKVSVVVPNFRNPERAEECLKHIIKSCAGSNIEVEAIIVSIQGNSTKHSGTSIKLHTSSYSNVALKMIRLSRDPGIALTRQIGFLHASKDSKYIAFLDDDVLVTPGWLDKAVSIMEQDPTIGAVQCRLKNLDGTPDNIGHVVSVIGYPMEMHYVALQKKIPLNKEAIEVLGGVTAALIVRREVFGKIGGFDPQHYFWFEDTDLCWRIWLAGYRVLTLLTTHVNHAHRGSVKNRKHFEIYHRERSTLLSLYKNLEATNLVKYITLRIAFTILSSTYLLGKDPRLTLNVLLGFADGVKSMWRARTMRVLVNTIRRTPDKKLIEKGLLEKNLGLLVRYLEARIKPWLT